jgi:hypothetical protein
MAIECTVDNWPAVRLFGAVTLNSGGRRVSAGPAVAAAAERSPSQVVDDLLADSEP